MGDYRLKVRMLLRVEGPRIYNVDNFAQKNGLFTFTFVRHPFERSISEIKADNFDHIYLGYPCTCRLISAYENKVFKNERGSRTRRAVHGYENLRKYLLDR